MEVSKYKNKNYRITENSGFYRVEFRSERTTDNRWVFPYHWETTRMFDNIKGAITCFYRETAKYSKNWTEI